MQLRGESRGGELPDCITQESAGGSRIAAEGGGGRQGHGKTLLYRESSLGTALGSIVCQDVTVGHNASDPSPGRSYHAIKGFDAVTGWGTPIGTALLLALM